MGYSARMAPENDDSADFDRLARRYLDLWQSQLAGLSADQALTEQIARLFAAANTQVASAIKAAQGAHHAASTGTPSAAASPGHGADDVGELRKRVAALEARIAELESRARRRLTRSRRSCPRSPPLKQGRVPASSSKRFIARSRAACTGWPTACLPIAEHAVHRTLDNPPAVWSEGNTRLLDYGVTHRAARKRGTRAVLVVPSLINRWEVLDLTAEKSLLRAMAAAGLRPYLVDWGTPNDEERRFDSTAYVARLERALGFIARRARRAPAVMGYCMGGTLTVALAARRPRRVAGLALLAAPWDFHADRTGHAFLVSTGPLLAEMADQVGELPVDILQTLFWSLDPWLADEEVRRASSAWTSRVPPPATSCCSRTG